MPAYQNQQLFDVLSQLDVLDETALAEALAEAEKTQQPLGTVLTNQDVLTDSSLGKIIADMLNLPYVALDQVPISPTVLQIIPEPVAKARGTIAYKWEEGSLWVATTDPNQEQFFRFLDKKTGGTTKVHYTTPFQLQKALTHYSQEMSLAFQELISQTAAKAAGSDQAEPPIIHLIDTVIQYAYQSDASDIHIEPLEEQVLVRFRVDGLLQDVVELPLELAPQLVTRVKVMANLRTDEHHTPQDGKITFQPENRDSSELDIRVSIVPITRGEKVAMRLLSDRARQFSLTDLGLSANDLQKVTSAYNRTHGMVLATGPTGSGKTTSLYSILKLLNKRNVNIMTIEDPVEYQIDNVNQIQVNPQTDLTFAKGLRSIVRQDPNIILVGEIRDPETADIAVNAAMTGHLVLSTLHTNDAATAFPRLFEMGVEPYLLASTINVVIAQRLVRKICPKCRVSYETPVSELDPELLEPLGLTPSVTTETKPSAGAKSSKNNKTENSDKSVFLSYRGKGCEVCHHSGYSGRVGIFEVLEVTDALREAITTKQNASQIAQLAQNEGMITMLHDGLEKVRQGVTTLEEVARVIKE